MVKQPCPLMLVVGTFAEDEERGLRRHKLEFADVRWMEISTVLRRASEGGTNPLIRLNSRASAWI